MDRKELNAKMQANPFLHLEDYIYQSLRKDIIGLLIAPGSKLSESKIAEELGVSRTPVRNALSHLTEEGLICKNANRVPVVKALTKEECYQIMDARLAIEGHAAYLAASLITEKELDELKYWINRYQKASLSKNKADILEHASSDHNFHALIVRASRNSLIQEMYQKIETRVFYYRSCLYHALKPEDLHRILSAAVRQHMTIYHAMKMGFSETVQTEVENDIRSMVNAFMVWDDTQNS